MAPRSLCPAAGLGVRMGILASRSPFKVLPGSTAWWGDGIMVEAWRKGAPLQCGGQRNRRW